MYIPILYFTVLTNVPTRFTYFFDGYQDYIADHLTVTVTITITITITITMVYRLATVSIQFQFGLAFFTFYILNNFSVLSIAVLILN